MTTRVLYYEICTYAYISWRNSRNFFYTNLSSVRANYISKIISIFLLAYSNAAFFNVCYALNRLQSLNYMFQVRHYIFSASTDATVR
jgi:hypothetical protein